MNEPQEKYEQSIEKVNLQLVEEKVNENTINVFNTVIKDEKQDKNYYIDINDYERQELIHEGDINKIHEVGQYFIEVFKACGMDLDHVRFIWSTEFIREHYPKGMPENITRDVFK